MVKKYLGPTGLRDLIELIKGDFAKKQDWIQYCVLPDVAEATGQVIQYTGESDENFTKGFFYYSTGITWERVETSSAVESSGILPDWQDAKPGVIYYDSTTGSFYIKDVNNPGQWISLTQEAEAAFEVRDALPDWTSALEELIYFVRQADGTVLGYIKNDAALDSWYAFGGGGAQPVIQSALNFKGVAANTAALPQLRYSVSGDMYIMQAADVTDNRFVEGPGQPIGEGSQVAVVNEGTIEDPILKYARLGSMMSVENIIQHFETVPDTPSIGDVFMYTGEDTFNYVRTTLAAGSNPQALGVYERVGTDYVLTTDTSVVTGKNYYVAELAFGKGLVYKWSGAAWLALTSRGSESTGDTTESIPEADIISSFEGEYK